MTERTVATIPDTELLRRAVTNCRPRRRSTPRWIVVMETFVLGSTFAWQLCHRFGLDPDEVIKP